MFQMFRELIWLNVIKLLPRFYYDQILRSYILKFSGVIIGTNVKIKSGLIVEPFGCANLIRIGDCVFINTNCRFASKGKIIINDNCSIGPNVSIETVNHFHSENGKLHTKYQDVSIENNVWIGANVTILPGVTIGNNSIIAAGSIVNKSIEPFSLVGGVPAKLIKRIK